MKRICIMRHAKADRGDPSLSDIERPLTEKGKRDCPRMGRWIAANLGQPDLIASSPAVRAGSTARGVAAECGYQAEIVRWSFLYPGDVGATVNAIRSLEDSLQTVLIVGHNPASEDLASWLAPSGVLLPHMSTADLAVLRLTDDSWQNVVAGGLTLETFVELKHLDT